MNKKTSGKKISGVDKLNSKSLTQLVMVFSFFILFCMVLLLPYSDDNFKAMFCFFNSFIYSNNDEMTKI